MIGADGKQGDFRFQAATDLSEAVEVGGVAGVVNGFGARANDVAAVSAMCVMDHACAPVPGGNVSDGEVPAELDFVPPLELDNFAESEGTHKITDPVRNDNHGRDFPLASRELRDLPQ
ncbi:MAG: hypothetical protein JWO13_1819 [Acidobacteriales bacterium]|nr:hypothetical protein [Terriglobales bacterium]